MTYISYEILELVHYVRTLNLYLFRMFNTLIVDDGWNSKRLTHLKIIWQFSVGSEDLFTLRIRLLLLLLFTQSLLKFEQGITSSSFQADDPTWMIGKDESECIKPSMFAGVLNSWKLVGDVLSVLWDLFTMQRFRPRKLAHQDYPPVIEHGNGKYTYKNMNACEPSCCASAATVPCWLGQSKGKRCSISAPNTCREEGKTPGTPSICLRISSGSLNLNL